MRESGKTSWVKRAGLLAVALLLLGSSVLPSFSVTIDTNILYNYNHAASVQRNIVQYGSNWWVLYFNGTNFIQRKTSDLTTFSAKEAIWSSINYVQKDGTLDIMRYGTSVFACTTNSTTKAGIYYNQVFFMNGTISSSSIVWSTPKQAYNHSTPAGHDDVNICTIDTYDGTNIWIGVNDVSASFSLAVLKSSDSGATWTSSLALNSIDGVRITALPSGRAMFLYQGPVALGDTMRSYYYNGVAWVNAGQPTTDFVVISCCVNPNLGRGLSQVSDPVTPSRVHAVYLNFSGYIKYVIYNSGWGTAETVATPAYTNYTSGATATQMSMPVLSIDTSDNSTIVAWAKNDIVYGRIRSSSGTWGAIFVLASEALHFMPRERDLTGSVTNMNGKILYTYLTGASTPFNYTLAEIDQAVTTTTTTATSTTTITTQTTTNDTIVDAVANQFAAVMENLFPALIIILVFVYLAYKAGASGEVLAYVFIITLVLTSFVNLMPWWITVIVSVIMIAILLNYRQRGGGVPQ